MAVAPVPILGTKLRPPARPERAVTRSHLVSRLTERPSHLWVIAGPAGFGKTTLLLDAVGDAAPTTAWITVDGRDRDPVRFWAHLVHAVAGLGAPTELALEHLGDGRIDDAVDAVLASLEGVSTRHRLVIDDLHLLAETTGQLPAGVVQGLTALIASPPTNTSLALATRHELELPIDRRRLLGQVVELGPRELAFTADEALGVLGDEIDDALLSPDDAARLVERLDGWPAGVRLSQLALRSGTTSATSLITDLPLVAEDLRRYLATEVLGSLPEDLVAFATEVSILMELTPAACDAVAGRSGSLAHLRRLAADHVFTTVVDPTVPSFRFHDLFREFLLDRLAEHDPEHVRALHARAASWAADEDDPDGVIFHAVAAEDHRRALETIEHRYIELSNAGRIDTLWQWVSAVGPERVLTHPQISAMPAWMSLNLRRYDEIEPWLESIQLVDDLPSEHLDDFVLQGAAIRSYRDRHLGRLDRALDHARAAVDMVPSVAHDALAVPTAHAVLGTALALTGAAGAREQLDRAIETGRAVGEETAVVLAFGIGSVIADDADRAIASASAALDIVGDAERFHQPAFAWIGLGQALVTQGRVGDAAEAAARAARIAADAPDPPGVVLAALLEARLHHVHGRTDDARASVRHAETTLRSMTGTDWLVAQLRATTAATRFAAIDGAVPPGTVRLSDRELAVLRLLPHRLSRRELAEQLFVSENTVKTHLTSIRHKLAVTGREDIVERAIALGLLDG